MVFIRELTAPVPANAAGREFSLPLFLTPPEFRTFPDATFERARTGLEGLR
jgi:hypothetical protein